MAVPMPRAKVRISRMGAVVHAGKRQHAQRCCSDHPYLRGDQVAPPVDDIGQRPGRQRQQKYRGRGGGLHQRHHQGAGRERGHQPACADLVHPGTDIRHDRGDPQHAEHFVLQWCPGRRG